MPIKQQLFALVVSFFIFVFTIEMVRRKRLREEYSVLWLATSVIMFFLILKYEWLVLLTNAIGAVLPTTTLFIAANIFLVLLAVQFSIKISKLTDQLKNLAQDHALLRRKLDELLRKDGQEQ